MSVKTFTVGALAACGAVTFTNPFEVIKTRMQLQGELSKTSAVLYKDAPTAFMTVIRNEGLAGLQRGLGVAYLYQIILNGTRLGLYEPVKDGIQNAINLLDPHNSHQIFPMILSGASTGILGAFLASPLFLIKTRLQSLTSASSLQSIGHQHKYLENGVWSALTIIYKTEGLKGLWRGADASMLRTGIGSSVQLSSYDISKGLVTSAQIYDQSIPSGQVKTHLTASLITSFLVCLAMNPFDVASTRMYNQKTADNKKVGALYSNGIDCIKKIIKSEGISALYKGFQAHYLRIGPHTVLTFVFLEQLKKF